ncbi:hypothetical protein [Spiroplasma poulsonii]|nr:hypothetical protein [Spiroplasma poulsonii]UNF61681.1 hypothetical protein MNU24_07155 [Spiroplasma poulsonii]
MFQPKDKPSYSGKEKHNDQNDAAHRTRNQSVHFRNKFFCLKKTLIMLYL